MRGCLAGKGGDFDYCFPRTIDEVSLVSTLHDSHPFCEGFMAVVSRRDDEIPLRIDVTPFFVDLNGCEAVGKRIRVFIFPEKLLSLPRKEMPAALHFCREIAFGDILCFFKLRGKKPFPFFVDVPPLFGLLHPGNSI